MKYILKNFVLLIPLIVFVIWLSIVVYYFFGKEVQLLFIPVYFFIGIGYSKLLDKLGAW